MSRRRNKILLISGGIVALIMIAAVVTVLLIDVNSFKPKIEAAVSEATGFDVRINGRMGISFFPFAISAKDIHVTNKAKEIVSLGNLKMMIEAKPLLKRELKVAECELVSPVLTIIRDKKGNYNFEGAEKKSVSGGAAFNVNEFKLSRGKLVYLDEKTGKKTELSDLTLDVKDLSIENTAGDIIKTISFAGSLNCSEVLRKDLMIRNLKAAVNANKGVFNITGLAMDIFGGKGEGDVSADVSEAAPVYQVNLKVSKADFEKIEESFGAKKMIGGKANITTSLRITEGKDQSLMRSMHGSLSLEGNNFVIFALDLDKLLSKYESTQNFNLVDLGAFFIAGPLGTTALRGYHYLDVYSQTTGGRGIIKQFVSHWKIKNGVADATDCALATRHNRIALKGKLDLVAERYDNVTVALLDEKGCSKLKQRISGPFDKPEISEVDTAQSLAGPAINLFKKLKGFVLGGKCEVFYNGSVRQP